MSHVQPQTAASVSRWETVRGAAVLATVTAFWFIIIVLLLVVVVDTVRHPIIVEEFVRT